MKSRLIPRMFKECEGQALAEYALIITFVALACVAALTFLGGSIGGFFAGFAGNF